MTTQVVEHFGDGKTMAQVRERTEKLRADMKTLIAEFYGDTGCDVVDVRLQTELVYRLEGRRRRPLTDLRIEIDAGF